MAQKVYAVRHPGTDGRLQKYYLGYTSNGSPRDASGKLRFVSNAFSRHEEWETFVPHDVALVGYRDPGYTSNSYPTGEGSDASLRNRAYGAFVSQMNGRQGMGGLGMTIATITQSRNMVVSRFQKMSKTLMGMNKYYQIAPRKWVPKGDEPWNVRRKMLIKNQKEILAYEKRKKRSYHPALRDDRLRSELKSLGGDILENMFGWQPLFSDINTVATIEKRSPPASFVSASVKDVDRKETKGETSQRVQTWSADVNRRLTYSGAVSVNSPNLYLANQLGLLNLAAVAWDWVPWSFLVGMFLNASQLLQSFTDFVGLSVSDFSETKTVRTTGLFTDVQKFAAPGTGINVIRKTNVWPFSESYYIPPTWLTSRSQLSYGIIRKNRVLVSGPQKPTFELRVPTPSLSLAAISLGLLLQKVP